MTDGLSAPEEIFFVELNPRPYMDRCYRMYYHKPDVICSTCNDTGEYKRAPGRHKKTESQRLYAKSGGVASLLAAHRKCCDIKVYQALPEWQLIEER